jgi:hypothetical protein
LQVEKNQPQAQPQVEQKQPTSLHRVPFELLLWQEKAEEGLSVSWLGVHHFLGSMLRTRRAMALIMAHVMY